MRIGFIGAGRVGFSLGKYLVSHRITVSGYCDHTPEHAAQAAEFTGTKVFQSPCELAQACDLLFLTTPDGAIREAWDALRSGCASGSDSFGNAGTTIICHCSGSLTSEVFEGIRETGAVGCSLHPMLAFSDRYASYRQLESAFFTIEGDGPAVERVTELFAALGNRVCPIEAEKKAVYHTAASVLSNQVVAVLDTGYRLLTQCGFSGKDARSATEQLVRGNVDHVIRNGAVEALTGPIERGDAGTVWKHLECLKGEDREMYRVLGRKLTEIAREKHPERDYGEIRRILE